MSQDMRGEQQRGSIRSRRSTQSGHRQYTRQVGAGTGSAYINHGEEDEPGSCGFLRAVRGVDQIIDAGAGEDKAGREEANDGNMVGLSGIGCDDNEDANDEAEHISNAKPGVIRIGSATFWDGLGGRNGGTNECDKPRKLSERDRSAGSSLFSPGFRKDCEHCTMGRGDKAGEEKDRTYHRDRDGSQRKRVADDVVHAHGAPRRATTVHTHLAIHFS